MIVLRKTVIIITCFDKTCEKLHCGTNRRKKEKKKKKETDSC